MEPVPVRSVKKALDLLTLVAFEDPAGEGIPLTELASSMGFPASSARNLLKTMISCGYVAQNSEGRYVAGPRCHQMGLLNALRSGRMSRELLPALQEITDRLGESVVFSVLAGGRRVVAGHVASRQVVRIDHAVIESQSIYELPSGRVLVAFASPQELADVKERYGWPGDLWDGIRDDESLERARQAVKQAGYCAMVSERHHVRSFACPVLDPVGAFVGALACYVPTFRCPDSVADEVLVTLQQAAGTIWRDRALAWS